jgi:hypothetical protein
MTGSKERFHQPTARECALLLLHVIRTKEEESRKEISRTRFTDTTLRRLWCRGFLKPEHLQEVNEFLFAAGWTLFFAGRTYAAIKIEAVEGWMQISSKWIRNDIKNVACGTFSFDNLEKMLITDLQSSDDE